MAKRIGDAGAEQLLQQTTLQEREILFPTDARSYDRARRRLVKAAKKRNIPIRQNYNRKAKQLVAQQSHYAHARQMKRAKKCTRNLRTFLGRVIRDIKRKNPEPDQELFQLLDISKRIHKQEQKDKSKI